MLMAKVVSAALLKEVRASASIGDGGRGRQNLKGKPMSANEAVELAERIESSEDLLRYASGSPISRTGPSSNSRIKPQGE